MKREILLLHHNPELKEYVEAHINSEYNIPLIVKSDIPSAYTAIKENPHIQMLIAEYELDGNVASELYALLKQDGIKMPMLLLTKQYPSHDKKLQNFLFETKGNAYFKLPLRMDELVEHIQTVLEIKRPSDKEGFRRVKPGQVGFLIRNNFDFYMLDDDEEYVQFSLKGNVDAQSYLKEIVAQDLDYVYIKNEDFEPFIEHINQEYATKMVAPRIKTETKLTLQFHSIENIHQSLWELGMTQSEIELAGANIKTSYEILNKTEKVSNILTKFMNQNNYIYQLAMLTSYMSSAILMHTDWFSYQIMEKLSMAAILQDVGLDNEEQAKITTIEDLELFDKSIKKKIFDHPFNALTFLSDVKEVSNETKNLILLHHERPTKSGFPKGLTSDNISPLGCVYILAHEFSHRLIEKPLTKEILEKAIADFEQYFSVGNFKKPYKSFKSVFKRP